MENMATAQQHSTLKVERRVTYRTFSVASISSFLFDFRPKCIKFLLLGQFWLLRWRWLRLKPPHDIRVVRGQKLIRVSGKFIRLFYEKSSFNPLLMHHVPLTG